MTDDTTDASLRRGSPSRVLAFSDGVFAIVITILVLEVGVPPDLAERPLREAIEQTGPELIAWVISFLLTGMYWVWHRDLFAQVRAVNRDVVWLTINSTHYMDAAANAKFKADNELSATILVDQSGKVGHLYDAKTTPHMFVIDPEGTLVYMGGIDDRPTASKEDVEGARNYVREALTALRSGQDVPQSTSRPYGCSIKYKS